MAATASEATVEAAQRRLGELKREDGRLLLLFRKGRIDEAELDTQLAALDQAATETQTILDQAEYRSSRAAVAEVTVEDLMTGEIRLPVPEDLAGLDDVGEAQVVSWLYAEVGHMRGGQEPSPEAITWLKSLMDRFDAIVVLPPDGSPRLELATSAAVAA